MFALHRTFPELAPAGVLSSTAAPVDTPATGTAGGPARPRLLDVVVDALDAARRDRGD